ncbi:TadE/TadG family type IV pilus assembly protein [Methylobacterium sp.]|jgi:Flp pilus assembly protein TadG|uniref:TadE/TadG family type IV pilus assembly protein n=1 Tax=Methylobacterium sp. TaxID=409 RepID=UPI0025FC7B79|nr:TadE/TadG family type IV pilus assembly protein [Methylobacterium sp.]MBY0256965.1 pilus assembly protein [Methylobacterium sp.]
MPSVSLRQFKPSEGGGTLVLFALIMPILFGLSAAALEYAGLVKRRAELQRAADGASIAGVNQFKLANADDASAIRTAQAMAVAQARNNGGTTPQVTAAVIGSHTGVQVTVSETVPLSFGKLLNMPSVDIAVSSTAKLTGTTRLCLLALDPLAMGAFHLESAARITAADCSLYSNSINPAGIQSENAAVAKSLSTCSAGGYTGASSNFTPPPATGCPVLRDPLADRQPPAVGSCAVLPALVNPIIDQLIPNNPIYGRNVVSRRTTLRPGTYCGGLHITRGAQVTLEPGIYVMKDGPLVVDMAGSITGANVGFYFAGLQTGLLFDKTSFIDLTAPKDGDMAGLLFFEERTPLASLTSSVTSLVRLLPLDGKGLAKPPPGGGLVAREYRIISDNARNLLGTIYLPIGRLVIDANKPIADMSAYTVIIARTINLYDGPNLMLNAQYGATDIPVPRGVGPSSADTQLTQ